MKNGKRLLLIVMAVAVAVVFCGCPDKRTDAEKAVDGLGDVMKKAEKNINEAYDKTEDAIQDALDEIK